MMNFSCKRAIKAVTADAFVWDGWWLRSLQPVLLLCVLGTIPLFLFDIGGLSGMATYVSPSSVVRDVFAVDLY